MLARRSPPIKGCDAPDWEYSPQTPMVALAQKGQPCGLKGNHAA
jgi:hypothetical protein